MTSKLVIGLHSFYTLFNKVPNIEICLLRVAPHPVTTQSVPTATGELGKQTGWT